MPIGNPQDILTTPYGYSGQVAPETAVNLQNLNRRRLIANMLMQQGAQPQQGQMVGRFYVPAGLARGFSGLGQTLAGALLAGNIDKKSSQAVDADRQMVVDAIKAYQDANNAGQAQQGQGAPLVQPPPTPDQPFSGEVGATPMPEPGVTVAPRVPPFHGIAPAPTPSPVPPPIPATRPASQAGIEGMQGLDMANMQPADMSAMVNSANPEMAQAQAATAQTIPQVEPPPPAAPPPPSPGPAGPQMQDGRATLAQLMTHQHPQVRAYGQFLAAMQQREQEREIAERHRQEDFGRDVWKHTTPSGNAEMLAQQHKADAEQAFQLRAAQMEQSHADAQAALNQRANQFASTAEFQKAQQELDAQQHRERMALERDKIKSTEKVAGMKASQKQVLTPQQEQKMRSAHAKDYQSLSTLEEKGDLALKKIDSILDPKKESSFNNLYGGYNAYFTERLPGETQDVKNDIESLKANLKTLGFDLIRQSGSIGTMTEKEWPIVADQIAKLDNPRISEPAARQVLEDVKSFLLSHRNKAHEVYDMEWGESPFYKARSTQPPPPPASGQFEGWSMEPIQ